ncbi:MAG: hypothetical protein OXH68_06255 [Gammaproteobacteria bacterium]|nr:hypothetical protein [Gammaproteobacteria bacterium]
MTWRAGNRLAVVAIWLGGLGFPSIPVAGAESKNCDELPPNQQAACLMVLACAAIDDDERREECFRVAAERFASPDEATSSPDPDAPTDDAVSAALPETPADVVRSPVPPPPVVEPTSIQPAPATAEEQPTASVGSASAAPAVEQKSVQRTVLTIPDRFTAEVTKVRRLLRDRQLVVLDGKLLFEGGQAMVSGLKVGDEVRVSRASSRFGNRFRIIGPGHRPFTAARIRCERMELARDKQRKCKLIRPAP